jgi:hypothetical protein
MFDHALSRRTVLAHAGTAIAASAGGLGLADLDGESTREASSDATDDDDCEHAHVVPDVAVVGGRPTGEDASGVGADADADYVVRAGDAVTFDASGTEADVAPESFAWTLAGEHADGERVHHAFERGGGVARVTLTVTDNLGRSAATSVAVAVESRDRYNRAPTPIHDVSPTRTYDDGYIATVGERLTFDARESTDPDGDVVEYEWAFRRGVEEGAVVERAFRRTGNYEVTLTVTDDDGATESVDVPIHVTR